MKNCIIIVEVTGTVSKARVTVVAFKNVFCSFLIMVVQLLQSIMGTEGVKKLERSDNMTKVVQL